MEQKLTKIFQKTKYTPEEELKEIIWNTIKTHQKRSTKIKLWVFSFAGIVSFTALIPTFKILLNDMTQSGFYEYSSLIFTNDKSILLYWKDLVFSLAESLPTTSIILTLSLTFIFFLSLRH